MMRSVLASVMMTLLAATASWALQPMTATVRVGSGGLYDYVIIGESPQATDEYENLYDTLSPGNLNADMGLPYVASVVWHPEWQRVRQELRGDIRSLAKKQEWQVTVASSLPPGTPLTVAVEQEESSLAPGMVLTLREPKKEQVLQPGSGGVVIPAPGPGRLSSFVIVAEQP